MREDEGSGRLKGGVGTKMKTASAMEGRWVLRVKVKLGPGLRRGDGLGCNDIVGIIVIAHAINVAPAQAGAKLMKTSRYVFFCRAIHPRSRNFPTIPIGKK